MVMKFSGENDLKTFSKQGRRDLLRTFMSLAKFVNLVFLTSSHF